jgi:hypothetical protein
MTEGEATHPLVRAARMRARTPLREPPLDRLFHPATPSRPAARPVLRPYPDAACPRVRTLPDEPVRNYGDRDHHPREESSR